MRRAPVTALTTVSVLAASLAAGEALAQNSPWTSVPPPPPLATSPDAQPAPGPGPSAPMTFGEAPAAQQQPVVAGYVGVAPPAVMGPPPSYRCIRGESGSRIAAEVGVAAGVMLLSMTPLLLSTLERDGRVSDDSLVSGIMVFMLGYYIGVPLGVWGVGNAMGGDGRFWAALLGNVLLPIAGPVIGYELSASPQCPPGVTPAPPASRGGPHPRLALERPALRPAGLRLAPWVAPSPIDGRLSLGVGASF